jgi:hypothetical protein
MLIDRVDSPWYRTSGARFRPRWFEMVPLLLGLVAINAASPARAQDILAAMRACESEQEDSRRLACYDRALNRRPGKPADNPSTQGQPHAANSSSPEEQFGMNEQLARKLGTAQARPLLDKLQARVIGVSYKLRGEPVIRLENGQVWEGLEGSKHIELKVGDVVTIWPGLFGSYRLTSGNVITPVTRVR